MKRAVVGVAIRTVCARKDMMLCAFWNLYAETVIYYLFLDGREEREGLWGDHDK